LNRHGAGQGHILQGVKVHHQRRGAEQTAIYQQLFIVPPRAEPRPQNQEITDDQRNQRPEKDDFVGGDIFEIFHADIHQREKEGRSQDIFNAASDGKPLLVNSTQSLYLI